MPEPRKNNHIVSTPGNYGTGTAAGTRAYIKKRNARNPGQGNRIAPQYENRKRR